MIKKIRKIGLRKLSHDTDISRIFKKIRNFDLLQSMILNQRQKYLLKFNAKNVISIQSEEYSSDSHVSIFSTLSKEQDRNMVIRKTCMYKLNDDLDERGDCCALNLMTSSLTLDVGRATTQQPSFSNS